MHIGQQSSLVIHGGYKECRKIASTERARAVEAGAQVAARPPRKAGKLAVAICLPRAAQSRPGSREGASDQRPRLFYSPGVIARTRSISCKSFQTPIFIQPAD